MAIDVGEVGTLAKVAMLVGVERTPEGGVRKVRALSIDALRPAQRDGLHLHAGIRRDPHSAACAHGTGPPGSRPPLRGEARAVHGARLSAWCAGTHTLARGAHCSRLDAGLQARPCSTLAPSTTVARARSSTTAAAPTRPLPAWSCLWAIPSRPSVDRLAPLASRAVLTPASTRPVPAARRRAVLPSTHGALLRCPPHPPRLTGRAQVSRLLDGAVSPAVVSKIFSSVLLMPGSIEVVRVAAGRRLACVPASWQLRRAYR
jgi:hypothetical protein